MTFCCYCFKEAQRLENLQILCCHQSWQSKAEKLWRSDNGPRSKGKDKIRHIKYHSLKVIEAVGGVNMAVCNSFLSQLETYNESVGLIALRNTEQHRCLLFPVANFLGSSLILKIATFLNNPQLCQLADQETPTSTSTQLRQTMNEENDEIENYNDISSKSYYPKKLLLSFLLNSVAWKGFC